jgi:hypothetical protein
MWDTTGPRQEGPSSAPPSSSRAMQVAECSATKIDDETEGRSELQPRVSDACSTPGVKWSSSPTHQL